MNVPNHTVEYAPFIKSRLASIQLTLGPYVEHIWSRYTVEGNGTLELHRVVMARNPSKVNSSKVNLRAARKTTWKTFQPELGLFHLLAPGNVHVTGHPGHSDQLLFGVCRSSVGLLSVFCRSASAHGQSERGGGTCRGTLRMKGRERMRSMPGRCAGCSASMLFTSSRTSFEYDAGSAALCQGDHFNKHSFYATWRETTGYEP